MLLYKLAGRRRRRRPALALLCLPRHPCPIDYRIAARRGSLRAMDAFSQCMLPCKQMGLRARFCAGPACRCGFFIFSHFDSAPVDSSWCHGWIVWRLRAIALIQCVERACWRWPEAASADFASAWSGLCTRFNKLCSAARIRNNAYELFILGLTVRARARRCTPPLQHCSCCTPSADARGGRRRRALRRASSLRRTLI